MTTKTYSFLCFHYGKNAPTSKSPIRLFIDGQDEPLLDIIVQKMANWDFDMPVDCNLWAKRDYEIPSWLNPSEFPDYMIDLKYFVAYGGSLEWSREWYEKLQSLDSDGRYAAIKMLNQKSFRSSKRAEIRARIEGWLNGTCELMKYDIANICNEYVTKERKCIDDRTYFNR